MGKGREKTDRRERERQFGYRKMKKIYVEKMKERGKREKRKEK